MTRRRSHFEAVEGGELLRGRTVGWVIGEIGAEGWTIAETLGRMRNRPRNWPGSKAAAAAGGDPLTPEAVSVGVKKLEITVNWDQRRLMVVMRGHVRRQMMMRWGGRRRRGSIVRGRRYRWARIAPVEDRLRVERRMGMMGSGRKDCGRRRSEWAESTERGSYDGATG